MHDVRHVEPRPAVLPGGDLHVRQAQLAVQHDVVGLAEGDRLGAAGDEEGVLLQEPEPFALLREFVESVRGVTELDAEVVGIHLLAVDGQVERRHRRQPEAPVPGDREPQRESLGVRAQAVVVNESVGHDVPQIRSAIWRMSECLAAHLLDGAPRLTLSLVLAGEVAGVARVLEGLQHRLPGDLLVVELLVDVVELRLDEHDVLDHVEHIVRVDVDAVEERRALARQLTGLQRNRAVLEDAGVQQQAEVLRTGAVDEGDVVVDDLVLDGGR
ncbi:hypothetical protein QE414_000155 [Microbacterium sp. SORGH_AS 344]|nr:hypothetical protein [Microbacterium sp. SORGH_AS_0344]